MKFCLQNIPHLEIDPAFSSEREWLDHLRMLAELPYPSLALMPSILPIVRQRVPCKFGGFGWTDAQLQPLAFMSEQTNLRAYRWWASNLEVAFRIFPLREQWEDRGEGVRERCARPDFEALDFYEEVFASQGVRWLAVAPVAIADGERRGFLSAYRQKAAGPFADEEQTSLQHAVDALAMLDSKNNPLSALPTSDMKAVAETNLLIQADGSMSARSQEGARLIYLLGGANMHSLEWARPDWLALPDTVREAAQRLFEHDAGEIRQRLRIDQPWGRFDFFLEKLPHHSDAASAVVAVSLRYFEAVDITVARRLTGWPLSPREKRIVVAGARNPNLAQLAQALGITINTLKSYNKEMVDRLGIGSRQELIEALLSDDAAQYDLCYPGHSA